MQMHKRTFCFASALPFLIVAPLLAQQNEELPTATTQPDHVESAHRHDDSPPLQPPALPEGMTLDDVLDYAANPTPEHFPDPIMDDELRVLTLLEQVEYRIREEGDDQFGWEAQGWIGRDYDKFWWKSDGEHALDGIDVGESENDLLYSRLISPFWNAQIGIQYANAWEPDNYTDRWSGAFALQGLAPGMFEMDNSLYISQDGDVTAAIEAEYNLRITQRLVLQPRAELGFAAQDIPERLLGAGVTDANLDLRLRYEIKRELAPYIGLRYATLLGETADLSQSAGESIDSFFVLFGIRLAF